MERAAQVLLAHGGRYVLFDEDALKRFSTPDIAPRIRALWAKHKGRENAPHTPAGGCLARSAA